MTDQQDLLEEVWIYNESSYQISKLIKIKDHFDRVRYNGGHINYEMHEEYLYQYDDEIESVKWFNSVEKCKRA